MALINNTPRDQVINLTKFLYGQTRATDENPAPSIPNWVRGNVANIRTAHRTLNLDVEGLADDQLEVTMASLVLYCKQFDYSPVYRDFVIYL